MMRPWPFRLIVTLFAAIVIAGSARADDHGILQYKAALTKIFLEMHAAIPVYSLNPVYPGDVIQFRPELPLVSARDCFPKQRHGDYVRLDPFKEGLSTDISAGLEAKGQVLSKQIAEIEADASASFSKTAILQIDPLSVDDLEPDLTGLDKWDRSKPKCRDIPAVLARQAPGKFVVARVFHGTVRFGLTSDFGANVSATARSQIIKKISRVFGISEAGVSASASSAYFLVSKSPDPKTLAVMPPYYSLKEIATIANFLAGARGRELEKLVLSAIQEPDRKAFDALVQDILAFFHQHDFQVQEDWARRLVHGSDPIYAGDIHEKYGERMEAVATYAAAVVLITRPQRRI